MVSVTGVLVIRNAFEVPYPFVEALLSIYPAVDEMIVVDGGSTDGTYEVLLRLERTYSKLRVLRMPEEPAKHYENIDREINYVMHNVASGEWLWQVQADEGFHEKTLRRLLEIMSETVEDGIVQPRLEVYWFRKIQSMEDYVYWTNRIVRITDYVRWVDGADDLVVAGSGRAGKIGVRVNVPFYHFTRTFPHAYRRRMERHLYWIGTEQMDRKRVYPGVLERDKYDDRVYASYAALPPHPDIPELFKPLAYMKQYVVREELFDPGYLNRIYRRYGFEVY